MLLLKRKISYNSEQKNGFLTKFYLVWRENQLNMCLLRTFGHSLFKKSEISSKKCFKKRCISDQRSSLSCIQTLAKCIFDKILFSLERKSVKYVFTKDFWSLFKSEIPSKNP